MRKALPERDGIRTTWARRVEQNAPDLHPDYEVSVGPVLKLLRASKGIRKAIRAKSADVIVQLANSDEVRAGPVDPPPRSVYGFASAFLNIFDIMPRAREAGATAFMTRFRRPGINRGQRRQCNHE